MEFQYDPRKAATNARKHGISFDDAVSVFERDPSAYTDFDQTTRRTTRASSPSALQTTANCSTSFIMRTRAAKSASSAPVMRHLAKGVFMKKAKEPAATPAPARSTTAVRGKYFNQLQRGTNLVILDPALMPHFPDSESVNRALHAFLAINQSIQAAAPPRRRSRSAAADFDPRIGIAAKQSAAR